MRLQLSRPEMALFAFVMALSAVALMGPSIAQPVGYHYFADTTSQWGIPFAMDVLSNIPFAVVGLIGLCVLMNAAPRLRNMERAMAALFFAGLVLTAGASSWYHLHPDDASLVVDRMGMSIAFAGLLGLGAAARVSERAGATLGLGTLLLAPLAVAHWASSGNVSPWVLVQFGGLLIIALYCVLPSTRASLDVRWAWVIAAYVLAKVFEINDHELFELTGHAMSGHTLKHVMAAGAAWPVVTALKAHGESVQNASANSRNKSMTGRRARNA
ncbi:MAG: hypothetical protein V4787_19375 [Pseudomonadota bacterium]